VVGETLTASATIEGVRDRGGMRFLILRTEVVDEAGELVASGRSTLIVRGEG
jgi:acyl dehydratase